VSGSGAEPQVSFGKKKKKKKKKKKGKKRKKLFFIHSPALFSPPLLACSALKKAHS
jgi:hypothetical protein